MNMIVAEYVNSKHTSCVELGVGRVCDMCIQFVIHVANGV